MVIHDVEMQNFGSVGWAKYKVGRRGLILVEGENRDSGGGSNGAGKSTMIPDAVSWCLYGKTLRGSSKDSVVRVGSTDGTFVKVSLVSFGSKLTITRYRNHPVGKSRCVVTQVGKDVTPAADVDAAIEKLLGVPWSVWQYALCLGQGLTCRFSQATDTERVGLLEELVGVRVYESAREHSRKQVAKIAADRAAAAGLVLMATSEVSRAKEAHSSAASIADRLVAQAASAGSAFEKLALLKNEFDSLTARLKAISKEVTDASVAAHAAKGAEISAADEYRRLYAEHARLSTAVTKATAVADVIATGECDRCGQTLSSRKQATILATMQESTEADQERADIALGLVTKAAAALEEAQALVAPARARVESLVTARREVEEELSRKQAALLEARTAAPDATVVRDATKAAEAAAQAVEDAEARLAARQRTLAELERTEKLWGFWVNGFARLRRQALQKAVEVVSERFAHYVRELFGVAIPARVELVEKATSTGAGTKVVVHVSTPGGGYETASGGERDRVDIALALALHDLVTFASGAQPAMLVADEIGGFVDSQGIERLVKVLAAKADKVGTVFVMSQNPVWRAHIEQVWHVIKSGDVTRLEQYRD